MLYLGEVMSQEWAITEGNVSVSDRAPTNLPVGCNGLSLTHNFAWTLAGSVTYSACEWIVALILAKLSNADMAGQFAFAMAIGSPITVVANLQVSRLVVST